MDTGEIVYLKKPVLIDACYSGEVDKEELQQYQTPGMQVLTTRNENIQLNWEVW